MSADPQSEGQAQGAPPSFHVRCARELFEALESGDGAIRLAALRAVQNAPRTSLSFGLHAKRDVVDVLLSQAKHFRGVSEWLSWVGALAAFRDWRVVQFFTSLITTESHTELLFALANYLRAEQPSDDIRIQLGAALMQNQCVARARAVAPVLAPCPGLSAGEELRIGLLETADETPVLFSAAAEEWLNELGGPFQSQAQLALRQQGESTLGTLVGNWDQLGESARKWLLEWAAETETSLVIDPIREVLSKRSAGLILAALEAAANLKNFPADLDILIIPFVDHGDELIRRAAVTACRSPLNWRRIFEEDASILVKQACVAKVMDEEGSEAVSFALQQLANPDWRIRAAATDGLLSLGKFGIRAALKLLPQAGEPVRVGIARMVIHSEDEELLNEFLQRCSPPGGTQSVDGPFQPHP